jgi:hypothetical protein
MKWMMIVGKVQMVEFGDHVYVCNMAQASPIRQLVRNLSVLQMIGLHDPGIASITPRTRV